jgi:signal transduction histidine kinase
MSTTTKVRRLELEAAERRVAEHLRMTPSLPSSARRAAVLASAAALFGAIFAARLAVKDPDALLANFYVVPIALVAIEFGTRAGLLAAVFALGLVFAWAAIQSVHVGVLGYTSRGAALIVTGAVVGRFSERLRQDIAARQRAQRQLSLYADQLEWANQHLTQSIERFEAVAEIARAVGGETDLERVISVILAHGQELLGADLLVFLPDGDELAAVGGSSRSRLPLHGSVTGAVLRSGRPLRVRSDERADELSAVATDGRGAILVPLVFRGERLGVLAGFDRADGRQFDEEDEELLMSVAASAATAVAAVRSVAAARLRLSLEAAEEARARWARELHDETLQGLSGVRMVLSAGLARDELSALRRAAETADEHLGEEMRKLRDLIAELRPAALDDLGLGPAIESLAKRQGAIGGFAVDMRIALDGQERLGRDAESATYRIVQEALSNAVKHAQAKHVTLRVDQLGDRIEIKVQDDGRGFDPDAVVEGFGLTGMRERALLLGGQLSVISADGGPTCVTAVLPISL